MTKFGERLVESAEQALAWARGEDMPGTVVHEPRPALDVREVRRRTGLTQAEFARPPVRLPARARRSPPSFGSGAAAGAPI